MKFRYYLKLFNQYLLLATLLSMAWSIGSVAKYLIPALFLAGHFLLGVGFILGCVIILVVCMYIGEQTLIKISNLQPPALKEYLLEGMLENLEYSQPKFSYDDFFDVAKRIRIEFGASGDTEYLGWDVHALLERFTEGCDEVMVLHKKTKLENNTPMAALHKYIGHIGEEPILLTIRMEERKGVLTADLIQLEHHYDFTYVTEGLHEFLEEIKIY